MPRRSLARLYKDEFSGYTFAKFQQDLLAGLTVAAVALPLSLAFAVASGASAAVVFNMTGVRLQANQELIAQGVGNILRVFRNFVEECQTISLL